MGLGDIAIEKFDPRFQTRPHVPASGRGYPGDPGLGRPILDPTECLPPPVPPMADPMLAEQMDFAQAMIMKTLGTAVEDGLGIVVEALMDKMPTSTSPPWIVPTLDADPIDASSPADAPVVLPAAMPAGTFNPVLAVGPFNARTMAYIASVSTACGDCDEFTDVEWALQIDGQPVAGIPPTRIQWSRFNSPTPFSRTIPLQPGQTFELVAGNRGAAPVDAFARIMGWSYTSAFISSNLLINTQGSATESTWADQQFNGYPGGPCGPERSA